MKRQRARQLLPPGAPRQSRSCRSALRELEAAAGLHAAVLLALDHAAVARQEPALRERRTQLRLEVGERLGNALALTVILPTPGLIQTRATAFLRLPVA